MPRVHPAEDGGDHRVWGALVLHLGRRVGGVQRDGRREHLDVRDLFGPGVEQHVAVRGLRRRLAPHLEEVLEADPALALDAADGLLEHPGEERVRRVDADLYLRRGSW